MREIGKSLIYVETGTVDETSIQPLGLGLAAGF